MLPQCLTIRSCIDSGGHIARVSASGPRASCPGPADFHVPRPRLQSILAATVPSAPNVSVYFDPSSGFTAAPSPPWKRTSCQDVPASDAGPVPDGVWPITGQESAIKAAARRHGVVRQIFILRSPFCFDGCSADGSASRERRRLRGCVGRRSLRESRRRKLVERDLL